MVIVKDAQEILKTVTCATSCHKQRKSLDESLPLVLAVENIVAVLATAPSALGLGFGSSKNITNAIMRALAHAQTRTLRMYSPKFRAKFAIIFHHTCVIKVTMSSFVIK